MLRRLHRINAQTLALFLALHLFNHAMLLFGRETHDAVMTLFRPLYRNVIVEPVLIMLFIVQAVLGLTLAWRRRQPQNGWALAQIASGIVLVVFLVQHIPAVLLARPSTDTSTQFAAAVVETMPGALYFIPYYILAVLALATHLAAARRFSRWPAFPGRLAFGLPLVGLGLGIVIIFGLRGQFG